MVTKVAEIIEQEEGSEPGVKQPENGKANKARWSRSLIIWKSVAVTAQN